MKTKSCFINFDEEENLPEDLVNSAADQLNQIFLRKKIAGLNNQLAFLERELGKMAKKNCWLEYLLENSATGQKSALENVTQLAIKQGQIIEHNLRLELEVRELKKKKGYLEEDRQKMMDRLAKKRQLAKALQADQERVAKILAEFSSARAIVDGLCIESFPPCEREALKKLLEIFTTADTATDQRQAEILAEELEKRGLGEAQADAPIL